MIKPRNVTHKSARKFNFIAPKAELKQLHGCQIKLNLIYIYFLEIYESLGEIIPQYIKERGCNDPVSLSNAYAKEKLLHLQHQQRVTGILQKH